jgi:hypothetical protein
MIRTTLLAAAALAALIAAAPAEAGNEMNGRFANGTDATVERPAIQGITLPSGVTLRAE